MIAALAGGFLMTLSLGWPAAGAASTPPPETPPPRAIEGAALGIPSDRGAPRSAAARHLHADDPRRYARSQAVIARALPTEVQGARDIGARRYAQACIQFRRARTIYANGFVAAPSVDLTAHYVNVLRWLGICSERTHPLADALSAWSVMPRLPGMRGYEPEIADDAVFAARFADAFRAYDRFLFRGHGTLVSPGFADANAVSPLRDAIALASAGHYAEAQRQLDIALARAPNFGYARLFAGVLYLAMNDRRSANREWIRAIEAVPPPTTGPEAFDGATIAAARLLTVDQLRRGAGSSR